MIPNAAVFGLAAAPILASGRVFNYETDGGAIADKADNATAWHNGAVFNTTFALLAPGDTLVIPNKTFHLVGGIKSKGLKSVTIQIDGTLSYSTSGFLADESYVKHWPRQAGGHVLECMHFDSPENVTFTSSGRGTLDGAGSKWWGPPGIGYLERQENRPRLIKVDNGKDLLFENIQMNQPPYWTFTVNADGLEVRHCDISARRDNDDGHDIIDLTAFNTDGFDVTGKNVWIHDCSVWNDDDCIAVKDGSENMLFERIRASGLGLTIGSIGGSTVRNITFRDCYMDHTYKGIYMKFRGGAGRIEDVTYENIVMDSPTQWPIWIGPAQQSDSRNLCAPNGGCSICWPDLPGAVCHGIAEALYTNITLRNITINNPKKSPGVILANSSWPMRNVVFDGVRVVNPSKEKHGDEYYLCEGVESGIAKGDTNPVPQCFKDLTDRA